MRLLQPSFLGQSKVVPGDVWLTIRIRLWLPQLGQCCCLKCYEQFILTPQWRMQVMDSSQGLTLGPHTSSGLQRTASAGQSMSRQQSMQSVLGGVPRAEAGASRGQGKGHGLMRQGSSGASRQASGSTQSMLTPVQGGPSLHRESNLYILTFPKHVLQNKKST